MAAHCPQLCLLAILTYLALVASADLRIQNYDRKVILKAHYAAITESIKIKNLGQDRVPSFLVCYLDALQQHESTLKAMQGSTELKVVPAKATGAPSGVTCYACQLETPIAAGDTGSIDVVGVYTKVLTPFPAHVSQGDPQLVLFVDNLYAVSPYHVSAQTTEVELPTKQVKSFTNERPASHTGSLVKFGRYDSIKPFTTKELRVHFEHDKPFTQVVQLVKEIEVSHWGNIFVEESYELTNGGALHKGQFSRLKYAHSHSGRGNSFRELRSRLPASAHSLYYKDLIGNISSSRVRKSVSETLLDFELRYPLMGGWKVDFLLGYSLPLKGFLFQLPSNKRRLSIDFYSSIEGVTVDELEVRVVLPEGSSHITASLPFPVESTTDVKYTYLDTTGRPVLVLKKSNLNPIHNVRLEVNYAFNPLSMLREPLMLVSAFAAFFVLVMVAQRWDFTISKDDRWMEAQNRDLVAAAVAAAAQLITDITSTLRHLESLASNATEPGAAASEKSGFDARIATTEQSVRKLVKEVEPLSAKAAADVLEVLEKAKAAQGKATTAVSTKVELLKKGAPGPEVYRKTSAAVKAAGELRREVEVAADKVFSLY